MSATTRPAQGGAASSTAAAAAASSSAAKRPAPVDASTANRAAKKKKPVERNLPPRIDLYVPESKLYTHLQCLERKLDATIMRKRLDMQEALSKPTKTKRILRVFLSNAAAYQPWQMASEADQKPACELLSPSWTFRIEGRLLDPPSGAKNRTAPLAPQRKFSSFLRSVVVEFLRDSRLYDGNFVEWHRPNVPPNAAAAASLVGASSTAAVAYQDCDGFEVKRSGDENVRARVMLHLEHPVPTYALSAPLAEAIGVKIDTKVGVLIKFWNYIKLHRLQDESDKLTIVCDEPLRRVFGQSKVKFIDIPDLVIPHLFPPDPIVLEYTIRVDKASHMESVAYDIEVEVDDPIRNKFMGILAATATGMEIQAFDDKISQCIQSISNSRLKRDFLLLFANSPSSFMNKWIKSQANDLQLILGESKVGLEEYRRSDFFKQSWVDEAVFNYLSAKTQRRMHELLSVK